MSTNFVIAQIVKIITGKLTNCESIRPAKNARLSANDLTAGFGCHRAIYEHQRFKVSSHGIARASVRFFLIETLQTAKFPGLSRTMTSVLSATS